MLEKPSTSLTARTPTANQSAFRSFLLALLEAHLPRVALSSTAYNTRPAASKSVSAATTTTCLGEEVGGKIGASARGRIVVDCAHQLTSIAMCPAAAVDATRAHRSQEVAGRESAAGDPVRGASAVAEVVAVEEGPTKKVDPWAGGGRKRLLSSWMPRWRITSAAEVEALPHMAETLRRAMDRTVEAHQLLPRRAPTMSI